MKNSLAAAITPERSHFLVLKPAPLFLALTILYCDRPHQHRHCVLITALLRFKVLRFFFSPELSAKLLWEPHNVQIIPNSYTIFRLSKSRGINGKPKPVRFQQLRAERKRSAVTCG